MKIPIKEKRASALAGQVSLFQSCEPRRHLYLEMTPGLLDFYYNPSNNKPQQVCAHFRTGWLFHFLARNTRHMHRTAFVAVQVSALRDLPGLLTCTALRLVHHSPTLFAKHSSSGGDAGETERHWRSGMPARSPTTAGGRAS